jgi:asparagine synthase (glutamine-hydrolysing)
MPGIVGIVKFEAEKETMGDKIRFLIDSITHEKWQKSSIIYNANFGFGKVDLEHPFTPLVSDEDVIAGFYGHAVAYKDPESESKVEIDIEKSNELISKKIIDTYKLNKLDSIIPSVNGLFSFFIWDKVKNKLVIGNDRYGLRPLYYRRIADGIIFSSELKGLIEIKQKIPYLRNTINKEAIVEFFTFQHLLGTKTMIREISILPPAAMLTYMDNEIGSTNYWNPKFDENNFNLSEKEALKELDQKLARSVQRRVPKSEKIIGLTLSGGLDSRCILALLCQSKNSIKINSFNYGMTKNNLDSLFGSQIAELHNSDFVFVKYDVNSYLSSIDKGSKYLNAEFPGLSMREIETYKTIRNKGISYLFTGEFGDPLSGSHIEKDYLNITTKGQLLEKIFHQWNRIVPFPVQNEFYTPEMQKYKEYSKSNLKRIIMLDKHLYMANSACFLDFTERQRRFPVSIDLLGSNFINMMSPFTDHDYVDFMLKLPLDLRFKQKLFKNYLKIQLPQTASVPRNNFELLGNESIRTGLWITSLKLKKYISLILTKIFRKELIKPIKTKGIDGKQIITKNWKFLSVLLLDPKCSWPAFLDKEFIFKIFKKDPNELKNWEVYLIDRLITFELWLQKTGKYIEELKSNRDIVEDVKEL